MRIHQVLAALVVLALVAHDVHSQVTNYGTQTVGSFVRQNSAAFFSRSQINNSILNRAVPLYGFSNANRGVLNNAFSTRPQSKPQKPFSNVQRGGTNVTPYIGLLSENPFNSSVTNYYALVRPQIEQQRQNEQIMKQNIAIQRRLNDIAAMAPYNPAGSEQMAPTGHVAVYQNMGGFYPQVAAGQRRR